MSVHTFLADLNREIRDPQVCVSVISKWVTITDTMLKKSAMVFVDQKGSKIEATLYEELEALNHITMNEGDWFDIRNFKVMHFSGLIRLTKNRYHIVMSNSTVVVQIQPKTCSNYYCFAKFLDIARGLAHPLYCIDLYGALVGIGELQPYHDEIYGEIQHKINFSLINLGLDEMKCVVYGDMAIKFYHLWNSTVSSVVLCVLSFWRIEREEGSFKNVTNIKGMSKIVIEPDIPEIRSFRMRIPPSPF
ncbi:hypothetical protein Bca52824_031874 [Brassica carinata]|uniref:Replication protein A 70 kDa DNA-binding subunit B/D first OB fold domain-containing protein n=1 Tax=Brassica carinata TaxID=52824 RepID=A0A8X7SBF9_BRACI|nr:hypothetical protein Bca52824_031874 [Brassica carinata]